MTARELVAHWHGKRQVCQDAVHDAVLEMLRRGWVTAFIPQPPDWDRLMVFLPQYNDFAAIIRCVDCSGVGIVPRGLIESRTQLSLANIGTGLFLSSIGIAIARVDGNNVVIRGTTPGLSIMAHQAHIHTLDHMPVKVLIRTALGKPMPRQMWTQELLLRVALTFDEIAIDVPGLLDGEGYSDVRSRWTFPRSSPRAANLHPNDAEPPFPAAPFDPPTDPDVPPF